jgi:hypothetical protein
MELNCGSITCLKYSITRCQFLYENPSTHKSYCMKFNKAIVEWTCDGWVKRLPECVAEEAR